MQPEGVVNAERGIGFSSGMGDGDRFGVSQLKVGMEMVAAPLSNAICW